MKRLVLVVLGLVAAAMAVVKMAELTMTRHEPVDPDSRLAVVVEGGHKALHRVQPAPDDPLAVPRLPSRGE